MAKYFGEHGALPLEFQNWMTDFQKEIAVKIVQKMDELGIEDPVERDYFVTWMSSDFVSAYNNAGCNREKQFQLEQMWTR